MKKLHLLLFLCMLLLTGCRWVNRIDTHKLELVEVNRHDTTVNGWIFADLKGDETDYLISMDTQTPDLYSIYVQDVKGKIISQTNSQYQIRSLRTLADNRDNSRWLFYSYNDRNTVFLDAIKYTWQIPLQRETKRFEAIPRIDSAIDNPKIEYYGQVYPEIIADIDGDGQTELLCRTLDGFTANPRGLVLFDFATGKIKWRYDLPCNVSTVLWDDFDGNGSKEIIISNSALKNTPSTVNGLDDASGWIVVLTTSGQVLYKEKIFSGYGQIILASADIDQDDVYEIYGINSTWGSEIHHNAVAMYQWNGSKLLKKKTLALSSTLERTQISKFLAQMSKSNNYNLHLSDKSKGLVVLDENLSILRNNYQEPVKQLWEIADLDNDGDQEIILQTDDDYLEVLDNNYNRRVQLKNPFPEAQSISVNLVRTGFETAPLICLGTSKEIRYYSYKHLPPHVFLLSFASNNLKYLTLVLLLVVGLLYYRIKQRQKVFIFGANILGDGLIVLNQNNKVTFCNKAAYLLAENTADPNCKNLSLCFPTVYSTLQTFIANKIEHTTFVGTIGNDPANNRFQITIFWIQGTRRRYMVILHPEHNDATEISDRMQWAEIARRLSHHVRRHITNILLSLETLSKDSDQNRQEYYDIIKNEIDKVRVFTHAFQRFTELKNYDLKLQDIVPSIEHCLARLVLPEQVKLIKSWNLHSVAAYIEPIRFEEAFDNMVNNALEAMPKGGNLLISIREFPLANSPQGHHRILVEIEDSGKGIPAKYMKDIWEPFFTTNQSGTGIGIPETKKIIDSMGGIMDIQSEENIGTTVSFWLKGAEDE